MQRLIEFAAIVAIGLAAVAAPWRALAAPKTPDKLTSTNAPVEMTAKGGLRVDLQKKIGVATGDVTISRKDVTVCCDRATAKYSGDRIESVECRGHVVIVRPDGTRARADVARFVAKTDRVTLSGKARLRSPEADLSGETIVYDIGAEKLDVSGRQSRFSFAKNLPPLKLGRTCPPKT